MSDLLVDFYTEEERSIITEAQTIINKYCSQANKKIDIWTTQKKIASTIGDIKEKSIKIPMVDLYVDEGDYLIISKAIYYLSIVQSYLTGSFYNKDLVAVNSEVVKKNDRKDNEYIIQFMLESHIPYL